MKPRPKYVLVSDVKDTLHLLAAARFSVVDPTYNAYLLALKEVEAELDNLRQYEQYQIRSGKWIQEEKRSTLWRCSICGARVFWSKRMLPCMYPRCPACMSPMENDKQVAGKLPASKEE